MPRSRFLALPSPAAAAAAAVVVVVVAIVVVGGGGLAAGVPPTFVRAIAFAARARCRRRRSNRPTDRPTNRPTDRPTDRPTWVHFEQSFTTTPVTSVARCDALRRQ